MQNSSRWRRIWRTEAGTRVIGVSMERSWPQGHHIMDVHSHPTTTPIPTSTQPAKSILNAKLVSKNLEKQGRYEVLGVAMERSWCQDPHILYRPPPFHIPTNTPTPHAKSISNAKLVLKNLENQGRYKGDWGVYGKVLTSGSPQNVWTPPHTPHMQNLQNLSRWIWRTNGARGIGCL